MGFYVRWRQQQRRQSGHPCAAGMIMMQQLTGPLTDCVMYELSRRRSLTLFNERWSVHGSRISTDNARARACFPSVIAPHKHQLIHIITTNTGSTQRSNNFIVLPITNKLRRIDFMYTSDVMHVVCNCSYRRHIGLYATARWS